MPKLLTILVLIISFSSSAQIPDYFGNNPRWRNGEWVSGQFGQTADSYYTYEFYARDTVSRVGRNYYRIYKSGTNTSGYYPNYTYTNYDYFTGLYVRQIGRKIMRFNPSNNQEDVFIDYGLNAGDTVMSYISELNYLVVDSIDSINIGTEYRRVQYLMGPFSEIRIIEGIGVVMDNSNIGTTFSQIIMGIGFNSFLYCYSQNGENKWASQNSTCNLNFTSNNLTSNFSIHPNPATNEITISHDYNGNLEYEILDLSGRRIFSSVSKKIDISNLTSGVYLVALKLDGKVNGVEKFIKG